MGERTSIEWTDATWNPWRGCDKVSPGCAHCYMFRDQERYGHDPSVVVRAAGPTFYAPIRVRKWLELEPGSKVFTCSWSDFFHADADPWREDAWDVIRQRPDLNWQILTKRPESIPERLPGDWGEGWPNVWLGVSIENRQFLHRADLLREIPAALRFISAEPLLGPLVSTHRVDRYASGGHEAQGGGQLVPSLDLTGIDWLITGGESGGPAYRRLVERRGRKGAWLPKHTALMWVRDLRDVCLAAGAAYFHKQWGGPKPWSGGRDLDGHAWDEFPRTPDSRPRAARLDRESGVATQAERVRVPSAPSNQEDLFT